jgi:isoquinoline 1-oxidoreductase beta subunit
MTIQSIQPSRRAFLAGGAGLVVGFYLSPLGRASAAPQKLTDGIKADAQGDFFKANAFVRIAPDDTVTVLCKHIEMGQGPYTGLTTIVAEELDADWGQMRAAAAPANDEFYKNLAFGIQGTGGSTAIANSYEQLRAAGATARAMLVTAAAAEWGVPASEITVQKGRIRHAASGKESGFGAFAEKAASVQLASTPKLKDPKEFTLIGTDVPRLDSLAKSNGTAVFTIDVSAPDMLTALVLHPEHFGAKVASVDDSATRQVPGVVDVKTLPQGVAVYADGMWAALKGREALKVEWDLSTAETRSSAQITSEYQEMVKGPGFDVGKEGDVDKAMAESDVTLEAEYIFPYLAHAPMEPLDAVIVKAKDGSVDIYSGAQFPTIDQAVATASLGLQPGQVRVHTQLAGGSFGRRAQPGSPYMAEAIEVFKAAGGNRPVKHLWLREDDVRGGYYRPLFVHKLKAALGADGSISAWDQVTVGQSLLAGTAFEAAMIDGYDPSSVEGANDMPYAIPNRRFSLHTTKTGVPVLWWRSVGHTHTAFTTETFVDELLAKAGRDPSRAGSRCWRTSAPRGGAKTRCGDCRLGRPGAGRSCARRRRA